ncbi:MAG: hypothetical protein BJ554DRAFT_4898 [Olpidium bornovanus]|uniref:Uncharacterized protein n=1 Tax=Olpidium bornovanus TaxID=278681 RepID=A0A8H7ZKR1_9FUNG|nr:MAG: hypothetical protein BJ554DRAFT_4898 [Olpidium bornovanus]
MVRRKNRETFNFEIHEVRHRKALGASFPALSHSMHLRVLFVQNEVQQFKEKQIYSTITNEEGNDHPWLHWLALTEKQRESFVPFLEGRICSPEMDKLHSRIFPCRQAVSGCPPSFSAESDDEVGEGEDEGDEGDEGDEEEVADD